MILLDEKISSAGSGRNMCTGETSTYQNTKDYSFFQGGFSTKEEYYRRADSKDEKKRTTKGPV